MEPKAFMSRMLNYNQTFFNNAFEAALHLQDQAEKVGNTLMDQTGWLPGESRQLYDHCVDAYKSGRNNFKTFMDENYQQARKYFG
jgi:hypothetical protein